MKKINEITRKRQGFGTGEKVWGRGGGAGGGGAGIEYGEPW